MSKFKTYSTIDERTLVVYDEEAPKGALAGVEISNGLVIKEILGHSGQTEQCREPLQSPVPAQSYRGTFELRAELSRSPFVNPIPAPRA